MTVKQISVFLENKPGTVARLTQALADGRVDLRALSLAETSDFGIARIITSDTYSATQVLKENSYVSSVTDVLAVGISDETGALAQVIQSLEAAEINVEYMYALISRKKDLAYLILRVEDTEKAVSILRKNSIKLLSQEDLAEL